MKTLTISMCVALIGSLLLSSCSSNYSITKRRYNRGYYVHHRSAPATPVTRGESVARQQVAPPVEMLVLPDPQPAPERAVTKPITAQRSASQPQAAVKHPHTLLPAELTVRNQIRSVEKLINKATADDTGDKALSLIWIVVVVLLVLYVIGLLAKVGGPAIHILLVIALVLLILWLLRII